MYNTIDTEHKADMLSRAGLDALAPQYFGRQANAVVLIVNLLHFRNINYALGHDLGDALLAEAQSRLQSVLPPQALAARVGSRFPVLLPGFSLRQALEFANAVRSAFERPLQALGFRCELGVHIGIALAPLHGDVYSTLLRKADVALYQAHDLGISVAVYDPRSDPHTPERLSLLGDLRSAAERGDLKLYCQPKIDMRSGELTGAEALVRWHHPVRGMILPTEFVPLLESTDLIMLLTEYMLRASARQSAAWASQGLDIPLAVNLSTRDVSALNLSALLPAILRSERIDSHTLGLEVTEGALLRNPVDSIAELRRLRALGFELHVDDFGTGFSSLAYLAELPVQVIKIDHGFTSRMMQDRRAASIVRATIALAHDLGLKVVAEGTADRAIWDMLQALDCDIAQGYFVARPFPAVQMAAWLHASTYQSRQAA